MKQTLILSTLFSAALGVGVAAQTQPPAGQSGSTAQKEGARQNQVTVTGCLKPADSSGAGAAAAPSSGAKFMLDNAKMSGGSTGTSGSGSTGAAAGAASAGASANRYKLEGQESDLQKYANSQVEIRGTLQRSSAGTSGASSSTASKSGSTGSSASGQSSSTSSASDTPILRVNSVRQVSPSCSGS